MRRASGFHGIIGMSLIERKDYGKTRMRGRKKNFKCYTSWSYMPAVYST